MRTALLTLIVLLCTAAPAAAAEITLDIGPRGGVVLGEEHKLSGLLTQDGDPLPGQVVVLEALRHPYSGEFVELARATTGVVGDYRFDRRFRRNAEIRVTAAGASAERRLHVFPTARITSRTVGRNRVRLAQFLTGPRDTVVRGRTRFYIGRARARTARFVRSAIPRRRRAGTYVARLTVRIPASYRGRFSFAACFKASARSALGDPRETCPRRSFDLRR